jgi:hypothetical protein
MLLLAGQRYHQSCMQAKSKGQGNKFPATTPSTNVNHNSGRATPITAPKPAAGDSAATPNGVHGSSNRNDGAKASILDDIATAAAAAAASLTSSGSTPAPPAATTRTAGRSRAGARERDKRTDVAGGGRTRSHTGAPVQPPTPASAGQVRHYHRTPLSGLASLPLTV